MNEPLSEPNRRATLEHTLPELAARIARRAPKKQGTNVFAAHIPWKMIHELRDLLDDLGIPWRDS